VKAFSSIELAQQLIGFDTSNPPGNELDCSRFLGALLSHAGFSVKDYAFGPRRVNLVARKGDLHAARSLCLVGHLDTVPPGTAPWKYPPFAATVLGDRIHGRGSCDMKSGIAAFVSAGIRFAARMPPDASLTLLFPGGEETGCEGSASLVDAGIDLSGFTGVIVAEPTLNRPLLGHKGALWLRARANGVAAHGAMPHFGVNAAVKAAKMILRLQDFCNGFAPHPVLGPATVNVGKVRAGHAINVVPDSAEVDIDLRTIPGMAHDDLRRQVADWLAPEVADLETLVSVASVFTEPDHPWVRTAFSIVERELGRSLAGETASYFTDASALAPALGGAPLLILGPGDPRLMHQTDEFCEIAQVLQAERIYSAILVDTLGYSEAAKEAVEVA
jgi:succinyl-diaminopimelate desuccinylase